MDKRGAPIMQEIPVDLIAVPNPRARRKRVFRGIVANIDQVGLKRPVTVTKRRRNGPRLLQARLWPGTTRSLPGARAAANPGHRDQDRVFDLDDVRTEIGEQSAAERCSDHLSRVDDAQTAERTFTGRGRTFFCCSGHASTLSLFVPAIASFLPGRDCHHRRRRPHKPYAQPPG